MKYSQLYNKTRIKQYSPIHYNGNGRPMSFVILGLLTKVAKDYKIFMLSLRVYVKGSESYLVE